MKEIRFLESTENLQRVLREAIGRAPNVETARQISSCLQQGRLFFEAASGSAPEIRPLLLSYGTIAFSRALVVSRTLTNLEQLPHKHGLRDVSLENASIRDLRIAILTEGTFQKAVDTARDVERLSLLEDTKTIWLRTRSCSAAELEGKEMSLTDILSRIPGLSTIYRETFSSEPNVIQSQIFQRLNSSIYDLRIDVPAASAPAEVQIVEVVNALRTRFPFLNLLNFSEAWFAWDHIGINFDNAFPGGQYPAVPADLQQQDGHFRPSYQRPDGEVAPVPLDTVLPASHGGLQKSFPAFTTPIHNVYLSEFALYYLGTYLLGSLVRYRPQIWVHALYGHYTQTRGRDDTALSLIESFLDLVGSNVPGWCASAIRAPAMG